MDIPPRESLATIAREWGRIGCIGFGGPPAHIALLRALCVDNRTWLSAQEFEDGVATTNLLPGPTSTQLAIYCAWRAARAARGPGRRPSRSARCPTAAASSSSRSCSEMPCIPTTG